MAIGFLPVCVEMRTMSPALSTFLAFRLRLSRPLPISGPSSALNRRSLSSSTTLLASKAKIYAVKVGRVPGVYSTWAEAEVQVRGAHHIESRSAPGQSLCRNDRSF